MDVDYLFFFFNDTATTEIYTLSLHDALPISSLDGQRGQAAGNDEPDQADDGVAEEGVHRPDSSRRLRHLGGTHLASDRKSTRLNSSHANISYAVFCLKKKKKHLFFYTHPFKS